MATKTTTKISVELNFTENVIFMENVRLLFTKNVYNILQKLFLQKMPI